MKMKRIGKISLFIILILAVHSFLPTLFLYLGKDKSAYTNEEALDKLKNNTGDYFAFIVFGDNHSGLVFNDSATLKLIRHINREDRFKKIPVDFVLALGDVTFRGSAWDYRIYNRIRSFIKWPVISAVGNHDADKDGLRYFEKYIGETNFSFADRNSYFIVLDNRKNDITDEGFKKLEEDLKRSAPHKHRFVIAHKSPLSLYQQSWYRPELSPWSYRFMKLCQEHRVDIVFSGHEHIFKDSNLGGVRYIMSGGGGNIIQTPSSDGGFLHYIVVRVYGDYVDYEVRRVFPPLWEFLAYYAWKDLIWLLKSVIF